MITRFNRLEVIYIWTTMQPKKDSLVHCVCTVCKLDFLSATVVSLVPLCVAQEGPSFDSFILRLRCYLWLSTHGPRVYPDPGSNRQDMCWDIGCPKIGYPELVFRMSQASAALYYLLPTYGNPLIYLTSMTCQLISANAHVSVPGYK